MRIRLIGGGFVLLAWLIAPGWAATISVGDHLLLPDTPGQKIPIYITAAPDDAWVVGITSNTQIADGGTEAGGAIPGPRIEYVEVLDDVDFGKTIIGSAPVSTLNEANSLVPQVFLAGALAGDFGTSIAVPAEGLLAVVTIDTTGYFAGDGPWTLDMLNTRNGPTTLTQDDGLPLPIDPFKDGSIAIVPEPSAMALLVVAGLGLLMLYRRRRVSAALRS